MPRPCDAQRVGRELPGAGARLPTRHPRIPALRNSGPVPLERRRRGQLDGRAAGKSPLEFGPWRAGGPAARGEGGEAALLPRKTGAGWQGGGEY